MATVSQEMAGRHVHLLEVARTHRLVLRTLEAAHDALAAVAQSTDLTAPVSGEFFKSVADVISFACFHRGYHIGKICTLRALLGKPRLFD
jgi:hypothetical protein